jgi:aryl-alcohol dehydrogenase-like predicted oxidoreductase
MISRTLWDGSEIPALGLGCWAIGGPWTAGEFQAGWGEVDDAMSIRAVHAGVDLGVRFFDTAQTYGAGHSETVLGKALVGKPDVRVGTKVGYAIDPAGRTMLGQDASPKAIAASIEASLKRLQRDRIDLVHLHLNALPIAEAEVVFDALESLRSAGKVAAYGWSTDFPDRAAAFAGRSGFVSVQHALNVFFRADALLPVIERAGLLSINRSPLAMGLLSGKYDAASTIGKTDIRSNTVDWMAYFKDGKVAPEYAAQLAAVRELLRSGGRSLVQGAIGWIWGRSDKTLPIPGFRTVAQVQDLAGALDKGPLMPDVMAAIEAVIVREPEGAPRER